MIFESKIIKRYGNLMRAGLQEGRIVEFHSDSKIFKNENSNISNS